MLYRSYVKREKNMERNEKAKSLGQYMTPKFVADFMVSLITKPKDSLVLEPSAGMGVFLNSLNEQGFTNIIAYEIDTTLTNISPIPIIYRDYLETEPKQEYDVIIGNPPYVRWKNMPTQWKKRFKEEKYWNNVMNGLSDLTYAFIYHSVNKLKKDGELIFICPMFWMETVHGRNVRKHIIEKGSMEVIVNLGEAKVFNEVSSTITIFKYVKGRDIPQIKVIEYLNKNRVTPEVMTHIKTLLIRLNNEYHIKEEDYEAYLQPQFKTYEPWRTLPPSERGVEKIEMLQDVVQLGQIAEIGNGMVSGLDKAFKLNSDEVKSLNLKERSAIIYVYKANTLNRFFADLPPIPYIFVNHVNLEEELRNEYPHFYDKLIKHKQELIQRYNYSKNIPWWHWVFLRNKHLFERYNKKILVPSKERWDLRGYCRFALVEDKVHPTYATQDVTAICVMAKFKEGIEYVLGLLNSEILQKWVRTKGFSRGGVCDFSEEPLKRIPILRINWQNSEERELHRLIVDVTNDILKTKVIGDRLNEINKYVAKLVERKTNRVLLDTFIR
jgi:adenine-specific DNA-methyltransferase